VNMRKSGDGSPGCGMVEDFISRRRGDANHAAMRRNVLGMMQGRCLDASSSEADTRAKQRVAAFYAEQERAEA
jgi:hypothetical protein